MARGRKPKQGKRTKSGQLSRAGQGTVFDKGSDWVQKQRARFGEHYSSAIGRAFACGLLGEGQQAKDRLEAGKRFARTYARVIAVKGYRCALDDSVAGNVSIIHREQDIREQDWLFNAMADLDVQGLRTFLDQLISPTWTDHGPYWVDALINGGRHPADKAVLDCALKALDMLVPQRLEAGILVVRTA